MLYLVNTTLWYDNMDTKQTDQINALELWVHRQKESIEGKSNQKNSARSSKNY
jgi:hypothetical protein